MLFNGNLYNVNIARRLNIGDLAMLKFGALEWISLIALIIGGLNNIFLGVMSWDIFRAIFGGFFASIIYIVICLAAVYMVYVLWNWRKEQKEEKTE